MTQPKRKRASRRRPFSQPRTQPLRERALVFISHDHRDAAVAEAFAELLTRVSAGMLRSFRSTAKAGGQGFNYGEVWFSRLMDELSLATDVVCILTEHSCERPWVLFEAGVAKGKLDTPVHGLVLGVPMDQAIHNGPFRCFQNCSGESGHVMALVRQLTARIPGCDPDDRILVDEVERFLQQANKLLGSPRRTASDTDDLAQRNLVPKMFEEVMALLRDLPARVVQATTSGVGRAIEDLSVREGDSADTRPPEPEPNLLREWQSLVVHLERTDRRAATLAREAFKSAREGDQKACQALANRVRRRLDQLISDAATDQNDSKVERLRRSRHAVDAFEAQVFPAGEASLENRR